MCEPQEPGQFSRPANKLKSSNYHFALSPQAIDDMRFYGYCTVMTISLVRDRVEQIGSRKVRAYYRRLEREADLVKVWSPYRKGAKPPPFDFDLSYNYYPRRLRAPGAGDQALPPAQLQAGRGALGSSSAEDPERAPWCASRRRLTRLASAPGEPGPAC